jgi:hypothetical protein
VGILLIISSHEVDRLKPQLRTAGESRGIGVFGIQLMAIVGRPPERAAEYHLLPAGKQVAP